MRESEREKERGLHQLRGPETTAGNLVCGEWMDGRAHCVSVVGSVDLAESTAAASGHEASPFLHLNAGGLSSLKLFSEREPTPAVFRAVVPDLTCWWWAEKDEEEEGGDYFGT